MEDLLKKFADEVDELLWRGENWLSKDVVVLQVKPIEWLALKKKWGLLPEIHVSAPRMLTPEEAEKISFLCDSCKKEGMNIVCDTCGKQFCSNGDNTGCWFEHKKIHVEG